MGNKAAMFHRPAIETLLPYFLVNSPILIKHRYHKKLLYYMLHECYDGLLLITKCNHHTAQCT